MKNNFNSKTQSVNPNDNDTFYIMLNDVVKDYVPENKLPENFLETVLKEYSPSEEGDTVMNGSYKEWVNFLSFFIDKYEESKNDNEIQFDFTELKVNDFFPPVVIDNFIEVILKEVIFIDEQILHITGNKYQIQRFYDLLKKCEYSRTKCLSL